MYKYYITADKIGEFVAKLYARGRKVSIDPERGEVTISVEDSYEWVKVFNESSLDDICNSLDNKDDRHE